MEKKEEETRDNSTLIIAILMAIMIIIPMGAVSYMGYLQDQREVDRLRQEIKDKQNVSNDYIQGWNDCIDKLVSIRNEATNVTSIS